MASHDARLTKFEADFKQQQSKMTNKIDRVFESLGLVPQSSDTEVVCTKGDDGEVMFMELIRKNDDSSEG
ncbi:hypothetical protein Tco_1344864 [Tanacetum coccineum]